MYCFLHDDNELHEWHVFKKNIKKKIDSPWAKLAASSSPEALIVAAWEHCFLKGC